MTSSMSEVLPFAVPAIQLMQEIKECKPSS